MKPLREWANPLDLVKVQTSIHDVPVVRVDELIRWMEAKQLAMEHLFINPFQTRAYEMALEHLKKEVVAGENK